MKTHRPQVGLRHSVRAGFAIRHGGGQGLPALQLICVYPCPSVVYSLAVCTGNVDSGTRSLVLVKYSADHSLGNSTTGFLPTS